MDCAGFPAKHLYVSAHKHAGGVASSHPFASGTTQTIDGKFDLMAL